MAHKLKAKNRSGINFPLRFFVYLTKGKNALREQDVYAIIKLMLTPKCKIEAETVGAENGTCINKKKQKYLL